MPWTPRPGHPLGPFRGQAQLRAQRSAAWKQWCVTNWHASKGNVYRYTKPQGSSNAMQQLHHGQAAGPTSLTERMRIAEGAWNQYWKQGIPFEPRLPEALAPTTGADIMEVVDRMNPP